MTSNYREYIVIITSIPYTELVNHKLTGVGCHDGASTADDCLSIRRS